MLISCRFCCSSPFCWPAAGLFAIFFPSEDATSFVVVVAMPEIGCSLWAIGTGYWEMVREEAMVFGVIACVRTAWVIGGSCWMANGHSTSAK
jgi:hypothetical protein